MPAPCVDLTGRGDRSHLPNASTPTTRVAITITRVILCPRDGLSDLSQRLSSHPTTSEKLSCLPGLDFELAVPINVQPNSLLQQALPWSWKTPTKVHIRHELGARPDCCSSDSTTESHR